jgi:nitrous oxide reductase accessory protein NosL
VRTSLIAALASAAALSSAGVAGAVPNPNPTAPEHTGTACAMVLTNNPNTGPNAHLSDIGGTNFFAVGAAFCGL